MSEIEIDEDGYVKAGTYAIAVCRISGGKADGSPVAFTESAICDVCGNWATEVFTGGKSTSNQDIVNTRISRRVHVVVYACPEHAEKVSGDLCDEYGFSTNRYDVDDLAVEVDRFARRQHE